MLRSFGEALDAQAGNPEDHGGVIPPESQPASGEIEAGTIRRVK